MSDLNSDNGDGANRPQGGDGVNGRATQQAAGPARNETDAGRPYAQYGRQYGQSEQQPSDQRWQPSQPGEPSQPGYRPQRTPPYDQGYATGAAGGQYGQQPYAGAGQQPGYGQVPPYGQYGSSTPNGYGQYGPYGQEYNQGYQRSGGYQPNGGYQRLPYGYQPREKIVAGLLGIFLGCLGVHNFYLGYTTKAVLQLLLTCVGWVFFGLGPAAAAVWGLIEGVLILCANYGSPWHRDSKGVELKD